MVSNAQLAYLQQANQYLAYTLDFTPDELALNRAGIMSQRQQQKFATYSAAQSRVAGKIIMIVLAIAIPGFIIVFAASFMKKDGSGFEAGADQAFLFAVVGVGLSLGLWALMMLFGFRRMKRFQTANHQLKQVTGQADSRQVNAHYESAAVLSLAGQPTSYQYITIGKINFYVSDLAAGAFVSGPTYRIYYVPLSGRVGMPVSAEAF